MSLFSVGTWIQSGNLGQGGKTGETKAPIAKMATDECIVSFVSHVEGDGHMAHWVALLLGSRGGAQGVNPETLRLVR